MDEGSSLPPERTVRYPAGERPAAQRLDPCCEHYAWSRVGIDMRRCGGCKWFCKVEGRTRTYRCMNDNRRKLT